MPETFNLCKKQNKTKNPGGSVVKNPPANAGNTDSIPESGRSPGEGNDKPFQYSCLENPVDRGAWQATVHGVARVEHDLATEQKPSKNPFVLLNLHTIFLNLKI